MKQLIIILLFALAPVALKGQAAQQIKKDSREAAHEVKRVSTKATKRAKKDTKSVGRGVDKDVKKATRKLKKSGKAIKKEFN
jgi:hypothetical protein